MWGGFIINRKNGNLSSLSGVFLKIAVHNILIKEYPFLLSILTSYEKITREKRRWRIYILLESLLSKHNFALTEKEISDMLISEAEEKPFRDEETVAILPIVADIISRKIVSLKKYSENEKNILIGNVSNIIRSLEISDTEELREKISVLDRNLRDCPGTYYFASTSLTKSLIRGKISAFAKRHKISEKDAVKIYCDNLGYIEDKKRQKKNTRLYFTFWVFFTLLFAFLALYFARVNVFIVLLIIFPISEAVKFITDRTASRMLPLTAVPRLNMEKIPDSAKTLTVITSLISDKDDSLFRQLEEFYLLTRDKNAYFGLLLDFGESESKSNDSDQSLISYTKEKISELNEKYGEYFYFFLRYRVKSNSENKYMGYERKRGALIDLVSLLRNKGNTFSVVYGNKENISDIKYVVTLDRDTKLYSKAVLDMVSAMLHPSNKPVIKNGRVISGYAIMQPHMRTSLASAGKSYFSALMTRGGIMSYQSASYDLYQSLFNEGIFCGKGIFDVDAYCELIPDAFRDELILSHDLLEGSRLRCGILADITLSDSHPSSPSSFFKRLHRWIRGDIQSTLYAKKYVYNKAGKREKNPVSSVSKFFILDNVRRALVPIFAGALILLSLLYTGAQDILLLSALSYLIIPPLCVIFKSLRGINRRFFSQVIPSVGSALWDIFFGVSSIFAYAFVSLDALTKGFVRSRITHKHTLEWTVSSLESRGGFFAQISWSVLSYTCGFFTLVFARSPLLKCMGLLWSFLPVILLLLSFDIPYKQIRSSANKEKLLSWVKDMWSYFDSYVTIEENYLPPDNVQESPVFAVAHRTSPTNIGMYLVSALAACDCGFIDAHTLYTKLEKTLLTIEDLPKKHGHLYNWYDTEKLTVLGTPYISTVDSGNFVVSLITLIEGISEYEKDEPRLADIRERLKNIAYSTDFTILYSKKRKLFYIGMDTSGEVSGENCYDLYMSEARSTYYFAVANGQIPAKSWNRLGRPIIGSRGYIGVASWSGSMFEYFMPHLFLPSYANSFSGEALAFAANAQIENRIKGFWGISESGYYAFDFAMNYQYRANGVSRLALDPMIGKDKVIAPYASFLCLAIAEKAAIKNLERLCKHGAYGKHGFYEALDFTVSRVGFSPEIIKSYMSHHVGMSIISAVNLCFDNIFVKRFMRDPEMSSVKELLCEAIPTDAGISKHRQAQIPEYVSRGYPNTDRTLKSASKSGNIPSVCMISSKTASLTASDAGHIMLAHKDILITRDPFDMRDMYSVINGLQVFYGIDSEALQFIPDSMHYSGTKIVFKNQRIVMGEKISSALTLTLMREEDIFCVKLDVSGKFSELTPMIAFEVVLTKAQDRASHPFYDSLSVEAFYDEEHDILIYHSRSKSGKDDKWLGISIENYPLKKEFDTRSDILPLNYTAEDIKALLYRKLPSRTGACISPYCIIKGENIKSSEKNSCEFVIAYGNSYEDILRKYVRIRKTTVKSISSFFASSMYSLSQSRLALANISPGYLKYVDDYLASLYFHPNNNQASDKKYEKNALWAHGISGDLPIVCLLLPNELSPMCKKIASTLIRIHKLCTLRGKLSDLVFIVPEADGYNSTNRNTLSGIISECGSEELFCRYGGVFLVGDLSLEDLFSSVSALFIRLEKDSSIEDIFHTVMKRSLRTYDDVEIVKKTCENSKAEGENALEVYGGVFNDRGFLVDKERVDLVWSYIYSNRVFGTLMTQNSLGFTWFANSKEKRLTPYFSSYRQDICGERLILVTTHGKKYDVIASSYFCEFEHGCALYKSEIEGIHITVKVGVDKKLPVKLLTAEVKGDLDNFGSLVYSVDPVIGEKVCPPSLIIRKKDTDTEFFRRRYDSHLSEHTVFLTSYDFGEKQEKEEISRKYGFLFGIFPSASDRAYYHMRKKYSTPKDFESGFSQYGDFYKDLFGKIQIKSADASLDRAINYYIPYQTFTARLFGRTGFYQSSGAYGFRDQLQDSLISLLYDPRFCKYQIFRAAAHQYTEGDVQHWWHNSDKSGGKWHAGLRSRCSDDLLWLPYAVSEYLRVTGDYSILDAKVRYIESKELEDGELTRYERPVRSKYRESLYNHCIRAIERALRFGKHKLPLIGSCDWNDGFDRVGHKGKGESVWLAQFMRMILSDFTVICKNYGDLEGAKKYSEIASELYDTLEKEAFDGDRYIRGFYDSGKKLGARGDRECEIDFLPQAFAAISGGDPSRAKKAILLACEKLWDRENSVVKLFTPPFSGIGDDPGYIIRYCDGFRENGGQYTHAATWAVWGLLSVGEHEKAYEMLSDINPIARSLEISSALRYKTEPYALCGDVYSNVQHLGRGGWSLYTGSASWFVRIVINELLGYREHSGESFTVSPHLCEKFDRFDLKISRGGCSYEISARLNADLKKVEIYCNGRKTDPEKENFFGNRGLLL